MSKPIVFYRLEVITRTSDSIFGDSLYEFVKVNIVQPVHPELFDQEYGI